MPLLEERYKTQKDFAFGGTATIAQAYDTKKKRTVVIKVLKTTASQNALQREILSLSSLNHKHIISMYDYIDNAIILQKMNSDLYEALTSVQLTFNQRLRIFSQVCSAVNFCHSKKLAHLDIKPENILLDKNFKAKLCDFGASAQWSTQNPKIDISDSTSTFQYSAPETFTEKYVLADKVDAWSLGVMLHVMFTKRYPFTGVGLEFKRNVFVGNVSIDSSFPVNLKPILVGLFHKNPNERSSVEEVILQISSLD